MKNYFKEHNNRVEKERREELAYQFINVYELGPFPSDIDKIEHYLKCVLSPYMPDEIEIKTFINHKEVEIKGSKITVVKALCNLLERNNCIEDNKPTTINNFNGMSEEGMDKLVTLIAEKIAGLKRRNYGK